MADPSVEITSAVTALAGLPGVADRIDAARHACTQLRWHQALRRRIPEAAAESRVRGAWASGELDGARLSVDIVRDLMRGAVTWHDDPELPSATARADALGATVIAYLLTGPAVFGAIGWGLDALLGTGFLVVVGSLAGMALSLYVIWLRYGTS